MNTLTPSSLIAIANLILLLAIIAILFRGRMPISSLPVPQRLSLINRFGFAILTLAAVSFSIIAFVEGIGPALRFASGAYIIPVMILLIIRFRIPRVRSKRDSLT